VKRAIQIGMAERSAYVALTVTIWALPWFGSAWLGHLSDITATMYGSRIGRGRKTWCARAPLSAGVACAAETPTRTDKRATVEGDW